MGIADVSEVASKIPAADLLGCLPSDAAVQAALYRSMSSKPVVREIPSLAPRATVAREVFPLYAVPSFAGLGIDTLKPLADKLFGPLFSVHLPNKVNSIKELAVEMARVSSTCLQPVWLAGWGSGFHFDSIKEKNKKKQTKTITWKGVLKKQQKTIKLKGTFQKSINCKLLYKDSS